MQKYKLKPRVAFLDWLSGVGCIYLPRVWLRQNDAFGEFRHCGVAEATGKFEAKPKRR